MLNILLFFGSCFVLSAFAWFFLSQGKSALTAWVAILSLLANIFVLKQITLFGYNTTASEAFAVGSLLGLNLLQEKFGWEVTQNAIKLSFFCLLFFALLSQIHLYYEPSIYDHAHAAYVHLFAPAPRLIAASMFTFFIVQQCDSRSYRFFRQRFPALPSLLASGIILCITQLLDTVLFVFLGLWGMISAVGDIILVTYSIKLISIFSLLVFSTVTRQLLLRKSHA